MLDWDCSWGGDACLAHMKPWFNSQDHVHYVCWYMPVIPVLGQEDQEFKTNLHCTESLKARLDYTEFV